MSPARKWQRQMKQRRNTLTAPKRWDKVKGSPRELVARATSAIDSGQTTALEGVAGLRKLERIVRACDTATRLRELEAAEERANSVGVGLRPHSDPWRARAYTASTQQLTETGREYQQVWNDAFATLQEMLQALGARLQMYPRATFVVSCVVETPREVWCAAPVAVAYGRASERPALYKVMTLEPRTPMAMLAAIEESF